MSAEHLCRRTAAALATLATTVVLAACGSSPPPDLATTSPGAILSLAQRDDAAAADGTVVDPVGLAVGRSSLTTVTQGPGGEYAGVEVMRTPRGPVDGLGQVGIASDVYVRFTRGFLETTFAGVGLLSATKRRDLALVAAALASHWYELVSSDLPSPLGHGQVDGPVAQSAEELSLAESAPTGALRSLGTVTFEGHRALEIRDVVVPPGHGSTGVVWAYFVSTTSTPTLLGFSRSDVDQ